jgi:protein TonB
MSRPWIDVNWPIRLLVILVSLVLHGALLVWLLSVSPSQPLPEQPQPIAVQLVEVPVVVPEPEPEPEPPEPEPIAELPPEPEPPQPVKPPVVKKVAPPPRAPVKSTKAPGPPVHAFGANNDWAAPPVPAPTQSSNRARPVPAGYADTVKNRVIANLKRPEGAVYKMPAGSNVDPNDLKRKCFISYEITLDSAGKMLSYEIDRCGDPLLDAAAEQAVLKAGPFPPPPNQGAARYTVYGTAIFIK